MDKKELQDILKESSETDLPILIAAKENAKRTVQDDPSAANLSAYDKAKKMLEEHLSEKETSFDNRIEALNYLNRQGYKIGKSKLYQDCKKGLLKLQDDGSVLESALKKYANKYLTQLETIPDTKQDSVAAQQLKFQKEAEKLTIQVEALQLELDIKKSLYISRPDFEMEFAGKVAILKAGLEFMIYSNALELVELVLDGDPEDAPQRLIEKQTRALESQFNDFANIKKFQVVFGEGEEIEDREQMTENQTTEVRE